MLWTDCRTGRQWCIRTHGLSRPRLMRCNAVAPDRQMATIDAAGNIVLSRGCRVPAAVMARFLAHPVCQHWSSQLVAEAPDGGSDET